MLLKEGVIKAIKGFDFFFSPSPPLFFFFNYYYLGVFFIFYVYEFCLQDGTPLCILLHLNTALSSSLSRAGQ